MNLPPPTFSSASILPEEYQFLQEFCAANGIKRVLEFGPGVSTIAFLNAGCEVVSIEENPTHFQNAKRTLVSPKCTLLLGAPPAISHHPAIAARQFDLAFVDGPEAKGPLPRLHSIQASMQSAPIIMLHDANRAGEKATIAEIMKGGGWKLEHFSFGRGIAILRKITVNTAKPLRIRFICNAHTLGGGEFSSSYLMSELARQGHEVILSPCAGVSPKYPRPDGVQIRATYAEEPAIACDLLVLYANDHAYKLEQNKDAWLRAMAAAGRMIAVLNFVLGNAVNDWFAARLATAIFLNRTIEREFLDKAKGFHGHSVVLPPPVNLTPFLQIKPDYSKIAFVRHSRIFTKYNRDETLQLIREFEKILPGAEYWFMPGPDFLRPMAHINPRIQLLRWNEESVPQFLSRGSIFWYRLPAGLREQGPRVIVEAMAAGIPCIGDNRDGPKDRITKDTGWLCNRAEDYVAAVREIAANPAILRSKGQAARARAMAYFSPDRWIQVLLSESPSGHGPPQESS